ncbi:MAG: DUF2852 domain-containing protein [Roseovarius sp.]
MNTYAYTPSSNGIQGWLGRAEAWLDDKGKTGWIVALVASMIVFWPVGLALLAYMIWSNKLTCSSNRIANRRFSRPMRGSSGNSAFDAYRNETLRRLEDEQQSFEAFLDRLRAARDKAEFDQFMEERTSHAGTDDETDDERHAPSRAGS